MIRFQRPGISAITLVKTPSKPRFNKLAQFFPLEEHRQPSGRNVMALLYPRNGSHLFLSLQTYPCIDHITRQHQRIRILGTKSNRYHAILGEGRSVLLFLSYRQRIIGETS